MPKEVRMPFSVAILLMGVGTALFVAAAYGIVSLMITMLSGK